MMGLVCRIAPARFLREKMHGEAEKDVSHRSNNYAISALEFKVTQLLSFKSSRMRITRKFKLLNNFIRICMRLSKKWKDVADKIYNADNNK